MYVILELESRRVIGRAPTLAEAKLFAEKARRTHGKHYVIEHRETCWSTKTLADYHAEGRLDEYTAPEGANSPATAKAKAVRAAVSKAIADRVDGFDRDDLGESPDY